MNEVRRLGTDDWTAYALFRSAVARGSDPEAKNLYRRALGRDPNFRAARVNLTKILIDEAADAEGQGDTASAERLRRLAESFLRKVVADAHNDGERFEDRSYYSALYRLSLLSHELGDVNTARDYARQLVESIGSARNQKRRAYYLGMIPFLAPRQPSRTKDLWNYLDMIEPSSSLVLGAFEVLAGEPEGLTRIERTTALHVDSASGITHYNIASAFALIAETLTADPANQAKLADSALLHLARSVALRPNLAGAARGDKTMVWLANDASTKSRFSEIVQPPKPPPPSPTPPPPLAEIRVIGEKHAEALATAKINDYRDLVLAGSTPQRRADLASKLGLAPALVDRWVRLADLMRVLSIREAHVNLLAGAGVDSVPALAGANAANLAGLLEGVASALETDAPTQATVTAWVQEASKLEPMVS